MTWTLAKRSIDYGVLLDLKTPLPDAAGCSKWNVPDPIAEALLLRCFNIRGIPNINVNRTTGRYSLRGSCAYGAYVAKEFLCTRLGEKRSAVRIAKVQNSGSDHYFVVLWTGSALTSTIVDLTWTQFAEAEFRNGKPYWLAGTISNLKVELKLGGVNVDVDSLVEAWTAGLEVGKKPGKAVG